MTEDSLQKDSLAAVVVLYNPDSSTIANIATYVNEVSHLYIVDNSEMPDGALISALLKLSGHISYHPFSENKGIAMALNAGVILAGNDGYKWILTMDQDSHFKNRDFFSSILGATYTDVAIIAASYNNIHSRPQPSAYPGLTEVAFVITSGNILNITAWRIAGGFIDKMFIDEVDNEFCIRARNMGFKILATNQIYLHHKLGEGLSARHFLTRKEIVLTKHSPLRVYYTVRNNLYIWRKFAFSDFAFVANRTRNIATLLVKIMLYFPDKKAYFSYVGKAIRDSSKGRYGKFSG